MMARTSTVFPFPYASGPGSTRHTTSPWSSRMCRERYAVTREPVASVGKAGQEVEFREKRLRACGPPCCLAEVLLGVVGNADVVRGHGGNCIGCQPRLGAHSRDRYTVQFLVMVFS